jgi:hypothetical protein
MRWATRSGVHIDRAARAWLIRRFLDPQAPPARLLGTPEWKLLLYALLFILVVVLAEKLSLFV